MRTRLSPDHSEALALARRLQRADAVSAVQDRRVLLLYWYGSGATHLRQEQQLLLDAWERHGGADHPLNASIRAEHSRLGAAIAAVAREPRPAPEQLRRVGRDLAAHMRRQELELSGVVERRVPAEELVTLAGGDLDTPLAR